MSEKLKPRKARGVRQRSPKPKYSLRGKARDSYLELIRRYPLVSIQSDEHLAAAQKLLDSLLARGRLDAGAATYLDTLSELVAAYEDRHHAIPAASDADMLRHFMDARAISQSRLSQETGLAKSVISEVLSGKKPFSRQMIRKLAAYFRVSVGVLAENL